MYLMFENHRTLIMNLFRPFGERFSASKTRDQTSYPVKALNRAIIDDLKIPTNLDLKASQVVSQPRLDTSVLSANPIAPYQKRNYSGYTILC